MLRVGITGGIGSGKTTVCKIFELLCIPVFYADGVAKDLMISDPSLVAQIKNSFGAEAYFADQTLNRKYISSRVFNNPTELALLNSFVHPAVFKAEEEWTLQQTSAYVLKEAALLFESGSYKKNDYNILVSATEGLRIARVIKRDGVTAEKVQERIRNQMSEVDKQVKADFFISNNDDEFLIKQVLALHNQFTKLATEGLQHSL